MMRKIEIIILFILATVINSWTSYDDIRTGKNELTKAESSYLTAGQLMQ